jgi:polysaccharide biosynthesis protein PslG
MPRADPQQSPDAPSSRTGRSYKGCGALLGVVTLAVVMIAGSVPPTPSPAALTSSAGRLPKFGVQFHGTWDNYTNGQRARVLNTLRANGATSVRIDVSWRMLQPQSSGAYSAYGRSVVDRAIRMAASRGLTPMVTLWMAPKWANASADERVPPTSAAGLAGLRRVAADLARWYHGIVSGWEVWNEPNSDDFMRGASPSTYAKVLSAAHAGFKQGDPASIVVFGGTMFVDTAWVAKALAAGAAGKYDVMGVHPYQGIADEPPDRPDDGTRGHMTHVPVLRRVMARYGDGPKPVWFTEFGWSAHPTRKGAANWQRGVSPNQAARYLARTLRMVANEWPYVQRVYWYKDRADSKHPSRAGYGLVLPNGRPVPALAGVRALYGLARARAAVRVKAVGGMSSMRVNVDPNRGRRYWSFRVQKQRKDKSWVSRGKLYRTHGRKETRTLNLPRGRYRVVIKPKFGYRGATSAVVVLKR